MNKGIYSHFEWITYIVSGLVILVTLDLVSGDFLANLAESSYVLNAEGMKTLALIAIAYMLGHANSHLAHWLLQEGMTAITIGRPSRFLLFGSPTAFIKYFRGLKEDDSNKIIERLNASEKLQLFKNRDDQEIFSLAFKEAQKSEEFREQSMQLLNAFNFNRNMTSALTVSAPLLLIHWMSTRNDAEGGIAEVAFTLFFLWLLVALRYLHFLHTYSSHILCRYAWGTVDRQNEPMDVGLSDT